MWDDFSIETDFEFIGYGPQMELIGPVRNITGGSITRNALSALRECASIDYGPDSNIRDVRFVEVALIADGVRERLGTFVVSTPSRSLSELGTSGTAECYSVLKLLEQDSPIATYSLASGADVGAAIAYICSTHGIGCVVDGGPYEIFGDFAADPKGSYLDIVSTLCDSCGLSFGVTKDGRVRVTKYREPSEKGVRNVYGPDSMVLIPEATDELDDFDVPNRVKVVCSTEDGCIIGIAENASGNRFSHDQRGMWVTSVYEADNLEDADAADEYAKRMLDSQSAVDSVTVMHLYDGADIGDNSTYALPEIEGIPYNVVEQTLSLTAGCPVTERARRFDRG